MNKKKNSRVVHTSLTNNKDIALILLNYALHEDANDCMFRDFLGNSTKTGRQIKITITVEDAE